jgi:peptidoglycan/LPS O-acetylase OafA/YrhL
MRQEIHSLSTHKREFGLDLLRCLAILSVLGMHSAYCAGGIPPAFARILHEGWVGVDLFFVLSGYLIGTRIASGASRETTLWARLRGFWERRWTRTLPLYFLVLFVYLVAKPWLFHAPFHGEPWRFFLFVQNFFLIFDFAQSWSLCIEEQFYLLFPLLYFVLLRSRHSPWPWAAFWALSPLLRWVQLQRLGLPLWQDSQMAIPDFDLRFRFHTLAHLDGLAAGVFLSATRHRWQAWPSPRKRVLGILGLLLAAIATWWCSYAPGDFRAVLLFSALSLGFALMLVGTHGLETSSPVLGAAIEKIALWSYGAYLWNQLIVRLLVRYPPALHWLAGIILFFALTQVVAFATYHLVEKPGLRLRRR